MENGEAPLTDDFRKGNDMKLDDIHAYVSQLVFISFILSMILLWGTPHPLPIISNF